MRKPKPDLKPYILTTGAKLLERCGPHDPHALTLVDVVGGWSPMLDHIGSLRSGDAVRLRTPYEWDGENGWTASFPDIEACLFESDAEAREKAVYVAQHTSAVYVVVRVEKPV